MPNCLSQKIPESKISTPPQKFLWSPPPLKIRSTPLPPPERSTRSFLDVGAFVEKERVTKPYKFGTVTEAHTHVRASNANATNKGPSSAWSFWRYARRKRKNKKENACCLGLAKWSWKSDAALLFFSFFFNSRLFTKHMLQLQMLKLKESI